MRLDEPCVHIRCDNCGHVFERQVGRNRTKAEVESIDDERPHLCIGCEPHSTTDE